MKEFTFNLTNHLNSGLRAESWNQTNQPGLVEALNCEVSKRGIIQYRRVKALHKDLLINPEGVWTWPYPQILKGSYHTFVCHKDKIQEYDEEANTLTDLTFIDAYNYDTERAITPSGHWHLVDTFNSWMLTNGVSVAFKPYDNRLVGGVDDRNLLVGDVPFSTGVASRGRILVGGFTGGKSWNLAWRTLIAELKGMLESPLSLDTFDLKENFVLWSSIGQDIFWLFYPSWVEAGQIPDLSGYDETYKRLFHMIQRNDFGWMPMPWRGPILRMDELGGNVVVYGADGVSIMRPVSSPLPTYELLDVDEPLGVVSRGAVGVSPRGHLFISDAKDLWFMGRDMKLDRLGYREFISLMDAEEIEISYDRTYDRFFIGDGYYGFVLNREGLTRSNQIISSIVNNSGSIAGSYATTGENTQTLTTDTLDFDRRELKTIQMVSVSAKSNEVLEACVLWRNNVSEWFKQSEWKLLNNEGNAYIMITALEFRIMLRSTLESNTDIDSLKVSVKFGDRRFRRGIDVQSINS